ncbi:MAG: hypothetical protein HYX76_08885 [Acidobacteria bacterium]|nr:hypothetical protein [Acidobacteriota bacterium]
MPRRRFFVLFALIGAVVVSAPLAQVVPGLHPGLRAQAPPAATVDGSLLSGLKFRNIGPANMSGRIVDIAVVEADTYTFYVASATGGLWKTTDNGVTFTPVFEKESVHSLGCVTLHQANPNIVWVGTGEATSRQSSGWGDGVYKSTDAGKTWRNMGLRDSHHVARVVLHPTNPDIVYVASVGHLWGPNKERGLYKSTDGGTTWKNILFVNDFTGVTDVAMDPNDPTILYAASYQRQRKAYGFHGGGPGSALYKSTDGGETWRKLTKGLPEGEWGRIGISIYRKDPRIVYISLEQGLRYTAATEYLMPKGGVYRSEDKGETWQLMSNWNPRPAYSSQIRVDPSDDKRIYMVSYSYSDDGGKTFTRPRQSLHGDDRVVWVNPRDSRHVIKGDDGGVGISYDRGIKWLYVTSLPVSQYYRVGVDMRKPFWVYGGLQDNNSWGGPSATYITEGILNEDWVPVGGGDGFQNRVDPTDYRTVYTASQYLGLVRVDMQSHERRSIRPDNKRGAIAERRNWETWGKPGAQEPQLGNAMSPANWDSPFIISAHDPKTLYAGMRHLWKSTDQGESWVSLGDLTTQVDRTTLGIMDQRPNEATLSLDDGIPYYPGITALSESPLKRGLLFAGTDDGNVQMTEDDGKTWTNLATRFAGVPKTTWVSGVEASRYNETTVYVAMEGHRSDDYANYLFKSTDRGRTFTSIVGDLPANRVIRAVHEDPKNANLIYIGTEFGFFFSIDGGRHWVQLRSNLPTVAVNDFVIHPRDNDLVLATHGRGIWILDNLDAIQQLAPAVLTSDAHLFTIEDAEMIRYADLKAHTGDMIFRGENPPAGAVIDYYLREVPATDIALTVHDASGNEITRVQMTKTRGINRAVWNLRYPSLPMRDAAVPEFRRRPLDGPFVLPGTYTARLAVAGKTYDQKVNVKEDPRLNATPADRRLWTETLLQVADQYRSAFSMADAVATIEKQAGGGSAEVKELARVLAELQRRVAILYGAIGEWTGRPTADQRAQLEYFANVARDLKPRVDKVTAAPSSGGEMRTDHNSSSIKAPPPRTRSPRRSTSLPGPALLMRPGRYGGSAPRG